MRIRIFIFCLLFGLLMGGRADAQDASGLEAAFPFLAQVQEDRVNIRAGQSTNFEQLGTLNKGDEVIISGRNFSWYKVRLPLTSPNYISSQYVRLITDKKGEVIAKSVNVRSGRGINSTVLGRVTEGDYVYILEKGKDWHKIEPGDKVHGWVATKFLTFKSQDVSVYESKQISVREVEEKRLEEERAQQAQEEIQAQVQSQKVTLSEKTKKQDAAMQELQRAQEEKSETDEETLELKGYLKPHRKFTSGLIRHKLKTKNGIYYIDGRGSILTRFEDHMVTIEGTINKEFEGRYLYPVVTVTRIELVL